MAFIDGNEIKKKLVGNKKKLWNYGTIFSPGPYVEEFVEQFEAYRNRNSLKKLSRQITAFKMSVHPSMGDARIVLSSILDRQINEDNITFVEVEQYLRKAYITTHSVNFYRATKYFLEYAVPKKLIKITL